MHACSNTKYASIIEINLHVPFIIFSIWKQAINTKSIIWIHYTVLHTSTCILEIYMFIRALDMSHTFMHFHRFFTFLDKKVIDNPLTVIQMLYFSIINSYITNCHIRHFFNSWFVNLYLGYPALPMIHILTSSIRTQTQSSLIKFIAIKCKCTCFNTMQK